MMSASQAIFRIVEAVTGPVNGSVPVPVPGCPVFSEAPVVVLQPGEQVAVVDGGHDLRAEPAGGGQRSGCEGGLAGADQAVEQPLRPGAEVQDRQCGVLRRGWPTAGTGLVLRGGGSRRARARRIGVGSTGNAGRDPRSGGTDGTLTGDGVYSPPVSGDRTLTGGCVCGPPDTGVCVCGPAVAGGSESGGRTLGDGSGYGGGTLAGVRAAEVPGLPVRGLVAVFMTVRRCSNCSVVA